MENMPEPALRALAIDFIEGKIFSDRHIPDVDSSAVTSVFMILVLMDADTRNRYLHDCGMLYEYMSERGPLCCNGLPMFLSVRKLSTHDAKLLFQFAEEYKAMKAKFTADVPAVRTPEPP